MFSFSVVWILLCPARFAQLEFPACSVIHHFGRTFPLVDLPPGSLKNGGLTNSGEVDDATLSYGSASL